MLLGDEEDILANPMAHPYTAEVNAALEPHIGTLSKLLQCNTDAPMDRLGLSSQDIPVLRYLQKTKGSRFSAERAGIVPLVGDLDLTSRAQIHNWIYTKIPGASQIFHEWVGRCAVAHAITLLLVYRLRSDQDGEDEQDLLERAWTVQVHAEDIGDRVVAHDVDLECLRALEQRMFECSGNAQEAGFQQWGLDAGDHQNSWDPYKNVPGDWDDGWQPDDPEESLKVSTINELLDPVLKISTERARVHRNKAPQAG